jgi:hypothetical protein
LLAAFNAEIFRVEERYDFMSSFTKTLYFLVADGWVGLLIWFSVLAMLFYIWFSYNTLFYAALGVIAIASLVVFWASTLATLGLHLPAHIPALRRRRLKQSFPTREDLED